MMHKQFIGLLILQNLNTALKEVDLPEYFVTILSVGTTSNGNCYSEHVCIFLEFKNAVSRTKDEFTLAPSHWLQYYF